LFKGAPRRFFEKLTGELRKTGPWEFDPARFCIHFPSVSGVPEAVRSYWLNNAYTRGITVLWSDPNLLTLGSATPGELDDRIHTGRVFWFQGQIVAEREPTLTLRVVVHVRKEIGKRREEKKKLRGFRDLRWYWKKNPPRLNFGKTWGKY